jgi:hypothetical protein
VALLSAGPVGPGDAIGAANTSLLLSTCRSDGLLLKPVRKSPVFLSHLCINGIFFTKTGSGQT